MIENKNFKRIGDVPVYAAKDVETSFFGIGFEKLDRNVFDPEKAYGKLSQIGVKHVRIQSGWQRTERQKGVYDFEWLDAIVDQLLAIGTEPWMCLCYGNELYSENAKKVFGAVGCPPIHTDEERTAWQNYVRAVVTHFKGRISLYEVWNEPDGNWCWKHGVSGREYGEFLIDTSRAVKAADPEAKVVGGAVCCGESGWLDAMLNTGAGKYMDALSYHAYCFDETTQPFRIAHSIRAMLKLHGLAHLPLIQGETGCPSRDDGNGALHCGAWTQEKQAKYLLRTSFLHLSQNVLFTSYFSTMDMIEALNGVAGDQKSWLDYGYFGVLGTDFDQNGFATGEYTPKKSYRALQTIAAVFRNSPEICDDLPIGNTDDTGISWRTMRQPERFSQQTHLCFRRPDGSAAIVYWKPANLMTESIDSLVNIQYLKRCLPDPVRLIDLMDGSIYEISPDLIQNGSVYQAEKDLNAGSAVEKIVELPLKDYPLALTFGNFF